MALLRELCLTLAFSFVAAGTCAALYAYIGRGHYLVGAPLAVVSCSSLAKQPVAAAVNPPKASCTWQPIASAKGTWMQLTNL